MTDLEPKEKFKKIFEELKENNVQAHMYMDPTITLFKSLLNSRDSIAVMLMNNDYVFYFPADEDERPTVGE